MRGMRSEVGEEWLAATGGRLCCATKPGDRLISDECLQIVGIPRLSCRIQLSIEIESISVVHDLVAHCGKLITI